MRKSKGVSRSYAVKSLVETRQTQRRTITFDMNVRSKHKYVFVAKSNSVHLSLYLSYIPEDYDLYGFASGKKDDSKLWCADVFLRTLQHCRDFASLRRVCSEIKLWRCKSSFMAEDEIRRMKRTLTQQDYEECASNILESTSPQSFDFLSEVKSGKSVVVSTESKVRMTGYLSHHAAISTCILRNRIPEKKTINVENNSITLLVDGKKHCFEPPYSFKQFNTEQLYSILKYLDSISAYNSKYGVLMGPITRELSTR